MRLSVPIRVTNDAQMSIVCWVSLIYRSFQILDRDSEDEGEAAPPSHW